MTIVYHFSLLCCTERPYVPMECEDHEVRNGLRAADKCLSLRERTAHITESPRGPEPQEDFPEGQSLHFPAVSGCPDLAARMSDPFRTQLGLQL